MKIKRHAKRSILESSSSSDIAFLLIIYFIVIAGFNINRGFLLNLPERDTVRMMLKDDLLRFTLNASGDVYLEDAPVSLHDVENIITGAVSASPNLAVVLDIESEAPWQSVVSFVELAQKLKVESFSFREIALNGGET
jgi:biopolymer transport protein ExbD